MKGQKYWNLCATGRKCITHEIKLSQANYLVYNAAGLVSRVLLGSSKWLLDFYIVVIFFFFNTFYFVLF